MDFLPFGLLTIIGAIVAAGLIIRFWFPPAYHPAACECQRCARR